MNELPNAAAMAVMAVPKLFGGNLVWADKPNHKSILLATFQPEDETGAILPGLSVQLEVTKAIVVDRCLYEFGLFKLEGGVRKRAYQLAVVPLNKRSHNTPSGPMFGPHEHLGEQVRTVSNDEIFCGQMGAAFAHFCSQISLVFTGQTKFPL